MALFLISCNSGNIEKPLSSKSDNDELKKIVLTISDDFIIKDWHRYARERSAMDCKYYVDLEGVGIENKTAYSDKSIYVTLKVYGEWVGPPHPLSSLSEFCNKFHSDVNGVQYIMIRMRYEKIESSWKLQDIS